MWDQAGCISPHVLWTQADPHQVARDLAQHVAVLEKELPVTLGPWASRERYTAKVLGQIKGKVVETDTALLASISESTFRPSPRNRFLWVLPADNQALEEISPSLSTLALSGEIDVALPAQVRTCAPGQMQRPTLSWQQDGEDPLLALLRAS